MSAALHPRVAALGADFLARYEGLADRLPGDPAPREEAAAILRERGLPSVRDEAWRYTSLTRLGETRFHEALTEARFTGEARLPEFDGLEHLPRIVFRQGRLDLQASALPSTYAIQSFADAANFGTLANPREDRLVALNTMLAEDGAVIDLAQSQDGGTLLLLSAGHDIHGTAIAFHPRHEIRLRPHAQLTIVEISGGTGEYLNNPVFEIDLGEGAKLTHLRLQTESSLATHLATIYVSLAAHAVYDGFTLSAGGRLARTEIHAHLTGPQAHATLDAAQILRAAQHGDFTTIVSHEAPGTTSRQTVKHVLDGKSRGVFQGKIEVARAAQKTDGYQMNQGLLLSPEARVDCKPQLEIYADDVKCSHGATVGALDPEQLFYMTSRGIPQSAARELLIHAFLAESLDSITDKPIRALFDRAIDSRWKLPS